jgi:hypothetical protein
LCDSLELEQLQPEEMTSAVVAAQRPCGFVVVVLRAISLADVTAPVRPDSHRVGDMGGSAGER